MTIGLMFPKPGKRLKGPRKAIRRVRSVHDRLDVDWTATRAARLTDPRSYVAFDGRWICYGNDMSARRGECYRRAKGICQKCGGHVSWELGEADHIKSKGQFPRDDRLENLQWLCGNFTQNRCHAEKHNREPRFGEGRGG